MISFIASLLHTMLFFILVVVLAAFGAGLWFLFMLRRGLRGGQQPKQRQTQQRPQQTQEPKPDPAQFEQPLFDEQNAEYVDFEEVK